MFKKYEDVGKGEIKLSKDDQIFLYKLALSVFKRGADGCEFVLDDIPELDLKVSIEFEVTKRLNNET